MRLLVHLCFLFLSFNITAQTDTSTLKIITGPPIDTSGEFTESVDILPAGHATPNDDKDTTVYKLTDQTAKISPEYSSFSDYLEKNKMYPKSALDSSKGGTVSLRIIVEKDGTTSHCYISQGIPGAPELDAEALRLVRNSKWIPAVNNGRNVRSQMSGTITFTPPDKPKPH